MKYKNILLTSVLFGIIPNFTFAFFHGVCFGVGFEGLICKILSIINLLIPVIFALALLYFLWGLARFILNAGNEEARTDARQIMIWGVIALFVMISVWGLVNLLGNTFLLTNTPPILPLLPII